MKIAFLAPEFYPVWGGVGIYSQSLTRELSKKKDIEIHVFTPYRGVSEKEILKYFNKNVKINFIGKATNDFSYNAIFQFSLFKEFPKYHKKNEYDIVHSANLVHMPDIFLRFKKLDTKFVVTAHTTISGQVNGFLKSNKDFFKMAPSEKGSLIFYPYIRFLEYLYLKKTKNLITVSNKFVKQFIENGYKGKIKAIHNGIDLDNYNHKNVNLNNAYKKFSQLKNKKIVLYAGRIITQKGIYLFIKLAKEYENTDYYFAVAGRGDIKNFERLVAKFNIKPGKLIYLGFLNSEDLKLAYYISRIFILPSYYENLPISLLEAMSMKCACVASDVGAVSEIIDNNKNGFLIKIGSYLELSNSFRVLINDENLIKKFSENGFKKVKNNFGIKKMCSETYKFYQEILK